MKFSFDKFNKYFFVVHEKKLIIAATIIVTILVLFELGSLRANRFSDSDILTSGRVTTTAQPATQKTTAAPSTSPLKLQDPIETQPLEPPESTVPTEPTEATMENIYFSLPPETTAPQATEQLVTLQYATVALPNNPPDYNAQWEAGYLLAIDNPDPTYKCGKVELSDEDRDLLERLCNGEFGSGGFIGASLIAQCVKNAMYFEGYNSVKEVISGFHYDGSTDIGTSDACRQAVRYIFDENHDAIQHRILYMYNPLIVASPFHESQNYIMTYQDVRFFDKWTAISPNLKGNEIIRTK